MLTKVMIEDALRYIGQKGKEIDKELLQKVEETFNFIEKNLRPKEVHGIFELEKAPGQINLLHTTCQIKSNDLAKLMANSEKAVILGATLGIMADKEILKRQKRSMLDAMIFDACCSVAIDKFCDDVEEGIMSELEGNQFLTMRFSPGYGDVPLLVSADILKILNAEKRIGLMMTDSQMLLPTKSITAIIGISHQKENRQKSCGRCNLVKSCMYRRRGERCGL